MKHIGNLNYAEGAKHKRKRIGRGPGSGHGGTSTRGNKGQQSRSGYTRFVGFEGGQMPLNRRIPKFGFNNRFRTEYQVVNVGRLQELFDNGSLEGGIVNAEVLMNLGMISKKNMPLKILGNGDVKAALTCAADSFSATAKQKIESAGGTVKINE